jgi:hypothetical protein
MSVMIPDKMSKAGICGSSEKLQQGITGSQGPMVKAMFYKLLKTLFDVIVPFDHLLISFFFIRKSSSIIIYTKLDDGYK